MFYRVTAVLFLILLTLSIAGATETVITDGVWWNSLTKGEQGYVMFGATSAYTTGYFNGSLAATSYYTTLITAVPERMKSTPAQTKKYYDTISGVMKSMALHAPPDFSEKPIAAYIDGMNYFYSNHPEASKLDFSYVFACIQNKPTRSCDDVAKLVKPYK
jgi:hypothetical protein